MKQPVQRRLAAILAADVAGYSRLMGADEEGTLERLKAHLGQLVEPKIHEHRGRIVKTTGDGVLAEFASVVDAVGCAAEVQRAMIDRNRETPEDQHIVFRIGVNLGDIIVDGDDIFGDGVNVAARLETLAEPGGICISRVVRDQIRDKLSYSFEDLGEQSVKNIARPVCAYAMSPDAAAATPLVVVRVQPGPARRNMSPQRAILAVSLIALIAIGLGAWWAWPHAGSSPVPVQAPASSQNPPAAAGTAAKPAPPLSIVVLPFENLSNDPDQEYFADGVTDDLTSDLSRISGSFVISRTTAFTYKGKAVDVRQIGRDLGVRYVLEGSVRRSGNRVHVNVQLIDAASEAHVWADQFDTDRANLAETQSEITGRLASTLHVQLVEAAARRIAEQQAADPDAQDLVMRGWAVWYRGFSADREKEARHLFERALELDPQSTDARVGVANLLLSWTRFLAKDKAVIEQDEKRAERLLLEALERDPNNSSAHGALGVLRRLQNRLDESRIELQTAIADDPNNWMALAQLGLTLTWLGRPEAGIPHIEQAIRLNPRADLSNSYWALGYCDLLLGRADEAIEFLRRATAANPRLSYPHRGLAAALGFKGDLVEAKAEIAKSIELQPQFSSMARIRAVTPWINNPSFVALEEKTIDVGLRRAGFPDK